MAPLRVAVSSWGVELLMKIGLVSLGCPKNLVDSEVMLGLAEEAGHTLTSEPAEADVLVVNTCAFIESAKQESIDAILEMAAHKRNGAGRRLIVTGCLAERYRDELRTEMPEIDAVLGTGEVPGIVGAIAGASPAGGAPVTFFKRQEPVSAPVAKQPADLPLRRRYAAPAGDAPALRLPEDRRRVRLQVFVLHHSDAPRNVSQPAGRVDPARKPGSWRREA